MGTATMSSAQLSKEFAVALTLIKKLDERDPGWEKKLPAKKAAEQRAAGEGGEASRLSIDRS